MRATSPVLLLALLSAAAGCSAPAFLGQTGRVTPRHSVRAAAGTGYQLATGAAGVVSDVEKLAGAVQRHPCSDDPSRSCYRAEDLRPVLRLFRHALVSPFGSHSELSARYGFARRFDAGVHLGTGGGKRADLAWQVSGPTDPGVDGPAAMVLVGYGKRSLSGIGTIVDFLPGEANLTDVEVAFVAGRQWQKFAQLYGGLRYLRSDWTLDVVPELPIDYGAGEVQQRLVGTNGGRIHHTGGVVGGALGYRQVYLGLELDLTWYRGTARVLFEDLDFSGLAVMPAVYLYGWY
jgi:hypothetical protein